MSKPWSPESPWSLGRDDGGHGTSVWCLRQSGDGSGEMINDVEVRVFIYPHNGPHRMLATSLCQFLNQQFPPGEARSQIGKLARQFVEELKAVPAVSGMARDAHERLVYTEHYETIKRLYLSSGLQGDDSRAVDAALHEAAKRVGLEYKGKADLW